jgi:hypothetical protein
MKFRMASPPFVVLGVPEFRNGLRLLLIALALRPRLSSCFGMPRRNRAKTLSSQRFFTARGAAEFICLDLRANPRLHESTIRRWMKNGVTSFGMPLDVSVKDNHLVISQRQADRLQEVINWRSEDRFWWVSFSPEFNFEKTLAPPRPCPPEFNFGKSPATPRLERPPRLNSNRL